MIKKQKKAVFHIELDGTRIHTDIDGNAIDLLKCLCIAMEHDKHIAMLLCAAAKAWKEFNEQKDTKETAANNQENRK